MSERVAAKLEEVAALQAHVSPPYLQEMGEYSRRLAAAEASTATSAAAARSVHCEVVRLLEAHGAVVGSLSESLVAWDDALSAAEARRGSG